jgi:ERCC4-related helicase
MVNCLNVKKYIFSIVSEKFAVSVSQEVSDTKAQLQELLKSRFSISQDLNFMLSLSVRFNLTKTE